MNHGFTQTHHLSLSRADTFHDWYRHHRLLLALVLPLSHRCCCHARSSVTALPLAAGLLAVACTKSKSHKIYFISSVNI
ncbi:hypothetical protein Hanom_Chr16g01498391 [Helianthus anomalus]